MKEFFSDQQIADAAGDFGQKATRAAGVEMAQYDPSAVPSPPYHDIAAAFGINRGTAFGVPTRPEIVSRMGGYPGMRVVVDLEVPSREGGYRAVSFPGIVLEPEYGQPARVGFLKAGPDALLSEDSRKDQLRRPLNDLQQTLLMQLYGMHRAGVGSRDHPGGRVNVLDSAHGAMVAITSPQHLTGLHDRSHEYADQGLARSVTGNQALDIPSDGRLRQVREDVMPLQKAQKIWVAERHQLPQHSTELGVGQLVVGTTLAAVQAKREMGYPQPDLSAGMAAVSAPLAR